MLPLEMRYFSTPVKGLLIFTATAVLAHWISWTLAFGPTDLVSQHVRELEFLGLWSFVAVVVGCIALASALRYWK